MGKGYGYGSYRGRSGAGRVLRVIIAVLVAILLITVLAVLWLGQYRVYSSDGLRLDIPFLQDKEPPSPPPVQTAALPPSPSLVITTPEPTPPQELHVAALDRADMNGPTAKVRMEAAGTNAVWFDMKADDGTLAYVSALPLAIQAKATAADPALNEVIRAMNAEEGLYTVARVSCFKDDLLSDADKNLNILTNSGYRWTDPQKLKWSSPTNETVRAYLAGVCAELAALGFDEIVLDNAGYPTRGNLGYIKKGPAYNLDQLDEVISGFYAEVKVALAPYPEVKLSIVTTEAALTGTDKKSGQTAENVTQSAQRVWIYPAEQADLDYASILRAAGMADTARGLVLLLPQNGASGGSWAVWPS